MGNLIAEFGKSRKVSIYEDKIIHHWNKGLFKSSYKHEIEIPFNSILSASVRGIDCQPECDSNPLNLKLIEIKVSDSSLVIWPSQFNDISNIIYLVIPLMKEELANRINLIISDKLDKLREKVEAEQNLKEGVRLEELKTSQNTILQELDKDGNGEVDVVEGNDFNTLLKKHQKKVIEIDRTYIQNFVKVANHLKKKKSNIQLEFTTIGDTRNQDELHEQFNLLKNQIHGYELLLFHSLNMIVALSEDDMMTFYEIYEAFDKMGIWNSNWENEVGEKLTDIGDGLTNLMYSINQMEQTLVNEIGNLTYITQAGFSDLESSVSSQLKEIDSSLRAGNLLSSIQTYQMYKINKNTKGLSQ